MEIVLRMLPFELNRMLKAKNMCLAIDNVSGKTWTTKVLKAPFVESISPGLCGH